MTPKRKNAADFSDDGLKLLADKVQAKLGGRDDYRDALMSQFVPFQDDDDEKDDDLESADSMFQEEKEEEKSAADIEVEAPADVVPEAVAVVPNEDRGKLDRFLVKGMAPALLPSPRRAPAPALGEKDIWKDHIYIEREKCYGNCTFLF